ncbi:MAG TPA: hypothetical protein HA262_16480 [Methanosarcina sp.]|jgi:hypothetical protein|nr:hypothetical protein [Methanosarcina sp.]
MAVFELENLKPSPEGEFVHEIIVKNCDNFILTGELRRKDNWDKFIDMGVKQMPEERREGTKGEKVEEKEGEQVADVDPIHPTEARGGKKRSLLDTCK